MIYIVERKNILYRQTKKSIRESDIRVLRTLFILSLLEYPSTTMSIRISIKNMCLARTMLIRFNFFLCLLMKHNLIV
jgi:hypothetical protein